MSYDSWLTTTPADRAHPSECNCEKCHEWHVEDDQVFDNAIDAPQDFQCCVDHLEGWEADGLVCRKHRRHLDQFKENGPLACEECLEEVPNVK